MHTKRVIFKGPLVRNWAPTSLNFVIPRASKFSLLSGFLVQKQVFEKGDGSHPLFNLFFCYGVVGGCLHSIVRKGVAKKSPIKHVFGHPILERRRVKIRERTEVNQNTTMLTLFLGGLNTARK